VGCDLPHDTLPKRLVWEGLISYNGLMKKSILLALMFFQLFSGCQSFGKVQVTIPSLQKIAAARRS